MSHSPTTKSDPLAFSEISDRTKALGAPFKALLSNGDRWPVLALGNFPQRAVCLCGDFETASAVADALNAIAFWRAPASTEEPSPLTRTERFTGAYADSFAA